jgi:dUTP pyrophosphatase
MYSGVLRVKKLDPRATIPGKARPTDAGWDMYACLPEDKPTLVLPPGKVTKIPTKVTVVVPPGYYLQLVDRSGMGSKGLHVFGGVIDEEYRGECIVMLFNSTDEPYVVHHTDKIAQGIVHQVPQLLALEVDTLEDTSRGEKGFGSSGR